MNPDYTAIALLVDRSGSMSMIRMATQDAINEFIHGQAQREGKRTLRLAQFDDEYDTVWESRPVAECPKYRLSPRGATALYDGIGRLINEFGAELADLPEDERPANVVFAIMTDGYENSSQEFTKTAVRDLIRQQEQGYAWKFLFMGANQDAVLTGADLGLKANSSVSYTASSVGTRSVLNTMDRVVASASSGLTYDVTDEDREQAMKGDD